MSGPTLLRHSPITLCKIMNFSKCPAQHCSGKGWKAQQWGSPTFRRPISGKYESLPSSCSTQHEVEGPLAAISFPASALTTSPQFVAIGPEVSNDTTHTATSLRIQTEQQRNEQEKLSKLSQLSLLQTSLQLSQQIPHGAPLFKV